MPTSSMRRSQVILRMPVDHVTASLVLQDGERSEAVLFVPPTDDIAQVIGPTGQRFLPMIRGSKLHLVARTAIACLGVPAVTTLPQDGDLPLEVQAATVVLRSGVRLEGELRWTATRGSARTADFLNTATETFELHTPDLTFHVVKAHVALVEER